MKILYASIVFFVACCFIFLLIKNQTFKKNEQSFILETSLNQELTRKISLNNLKNILENNNQKILELDSFFLKRDNVVPLFDFIEQNAVSVNAVAEVKSVETPKEGDSIILSIESKGSFESLYKFLILLENAPYELEIINMDLTQISEDKQWNLELKIRLLTFLP